MKTIHKYLIEITDFQIIKVPTGAEFIHVDVQHNNVCLWAMVDTELPMEDRRIRVIGTGLDADDVQKHQHIGSVLVLNGTYVFHIFDVGVAIQ